MGESGLDVAERFTVFVYETHPHLEEYGITSDEYLNVSVDPMDKRLINWGNDTIKAVRETFSKKKWSPARINSIYLRTNLKFGLFRP